MIKAVIFDFFGVICSENYWREVKQNKAIHSEFQDLGKEVNLANLSWRKFVIAVADKMGVSVEKVVEFFENESIDPRMISYISTLSDKYKCALITNAHHDFFDPIAEQGGLDKVFDIIIVSSRAGVVKPHPSIFKLALNKLDVEPRECIFIDDSSGNVKAAEDIGIKSVLFTTYEESRPKIDRLLADSYN